MVEICKCFFYRDQQNDERSLLSLKVPYLQVEFRIVVALLMIGSTIWSSFNNIRAVSQGGCGRNFSSVAVRKFDSKYFEKVRFFFLTGYKYYFSGLAYWICYVSLFCCF